MKLKRERLCYAWGWMKMKWRWNLILQGADCSKSVCPVLCSSHGQYGGGVCHCEDGWKGAECDIPLTDCQVPDCNQHGQCVQGTCICSAGWKGPFCSERTCRTKIWMLINTRADWNAIPGCCSVFYIRSLLRPGYLMNNCIMKVALPNSIVQFHTMRLNKSPWATERQATNTFFLPLTIIRSVRDRVPTIFIVSPFFSVIFVAVIFYFIII